MAKNVAEILILKAVVHKGEVKRVNASELSKHLIAYFPRDPLEKHLLFNLLYWLAEGESLSLDLISRRLGYSREKLDDLLSKLPGVERDSAENIIATAGLTLQETSYPMDSEKCRIYAQSGLDAIVVPTLLLTKIGIEYRCPDDPVAVHLRFGFDQAFALQPDQAVISFPSRKNIAKCLRENRSEFRLFPTPDSARRWLWQHTDGVILTVKNVFVAAVTLRRSLMDSNTSMLTSTQGTEGR
ncbi:organomercurial lyase [Bdellovibrionota bacterium FG-1]